MDLFRKLSRLFSSREKRLIAVLGLLILFGGVLDTLGIGIIMPFIGIIAAPDLALKNHYMARAYELGHFSSFPQFVIWCGVVIVVLFIVKNLFLLGLGYIENRFSANREVSISKRLLEAYIYQPYIFHLRVNSAELLGKLKGVPNIFNLVLRPMMIITTEAVVLLLIVTMLLLVDPIPALVAIGLFGGTIIVFYRSVKKKLKTLGMEQFEHSVDVYKWVAQALGSIKETRILGTEQYFVEEFRAAQRNVALSLMWTQFLSQTPRLFTESIVIASVISITCIIFFRNPNPQTAIPTLGLFAMAAVRMMPSLNRIVSNIAIVRVSKTVVDIITSDLLQLEPDSKSEQFEAQKTFKPLRLENTVTIENVSYCYPGTDRFVLRDVSLSIRKGTSVGLIGPSGSGKTTLADIVLGLLSPTNGCIKVDGADIAKNVRSWQKSLGYIPQSIYLTDDSIRRNVALGIDDSCIDDAAVWAALRAAQLDEFVRALPKGLDTEVGERGVRVSGGQRQRIGIARALYPNPDVLVLDEATSALDHDTEREVSAAIDALGGTKTLIIIAHRLSTAKRCDVIYKVVDGRIASSGSYSEVIGTGEESRV